MSKKDKFFLGAMIGAVGGAIAGILMAPKSGKETRKEIGDKAKEYGQKGKEALERGKEKGRAKVEDVKQAISKKKE